MTNSGTPVTLIDPAQTEPDIILQLLDAAEVVAKAVPSLTGSTGASLESRVAALESVTTVTVPLLRHAYTSLYSMLHGTPAPAPAPTNLPAESLPPA